MRVGQGLDKVPRGHNSEIEEFINASGSWPSAPIPASQK